MSLTYHSAAITDIGKARPENEDRYLREDSLGLFGVADGIGGLPGGAEASACTVAGIIRLVATQGRAPLDLVDITQAVSANVRDLGHLMNPRSGIGSTLTYGVLKNDTLHLAHVGDSRAYLLRDGQLTQLTRDHNIGNEIEALRERGEHIELTFENRHALSRCIGQPGLPEVDYQAITVQSGDRYFFSTDGIFNLIDDAELAQLLAASVSADAILKDIIALGLERGGHDNLTAVLLIIDKR